MRIKLYEIKDITIADYCAKNFTTSKSHWCTRNIVAIVLNKINNVMVVRMMAAKTLVMSTKTLERAIVVR